MNIFEWLRGQSWNPFIGNAIIAGVILIATLLLGGFLIQGAVPFASFIAVVVFFGIPELLRILPNFLSKYFVADERPRAALQVRLFRLSGAAATLLVWAVVFWI